MKLKDFLQIAKYANANWAKNSFTIREIVENAEIYYIDFLWSKENETISETIKTLCKNFAEDIREIPNLVVPKQWLYKIASELGLIDMDYTDYLDTDEWLAEFIE